MELCCDEFDALISILARTEVRALPPVVFHDRGAFLVSILARTEVRALHLVPVPAGLFNAFQSSPAPRCGRYPVAVTPGGQQTCFNPRPHRGAGATADQYYDPLIAGFQSSPAPRCGRYGKAANICKLCTSFNPRPHRGAGATAYQDRLPATQPCFNPRPHRGAGATSRMAIRAYPLPCFNPRPHRGAGATCQMIRGTLVIRVSILARTEVRALRLSGVTGAAG